MKYIALRIAHRKQRGVVALTGVLACAASAFVILSTQPAHASGATRSGRIGGIIPPKSKAKVLTGSQYDLTYHGGPVMRINKTYLIYWIPSGYSVSANYKTLIDRFFGDVASDSGGTQNVYSVLNQYYDTTGPIAYQSSLGGSAIDTDPFPAAVDCNPYIVGLTRCLSDAQIQAEIESFIASKSWTTNSTTEFFMFTPNDVGSCDGNLCAYNSYCAYHGVGADDPNLNYANEPYSAFFDGCESGESPNGDAAADSEINLASHEHRAGINDEHFDAWYNDLTGNEGSDNCAWQFGAVLGGPPGAEYNQLVNGHQYYLQQEWSNDGSICLLRYNGGSPPGPTIMNFSPGTGTAGDGVVITGTNLTGASGVYFTGTAATSFTVDSDTQITATVPAGATSGPIAVAAPGGLTTSTDDFMITPDAGYLRLTTTPALASQLLIDGVPADSWGLNWLKLPPGDHTVDFSHVEGYTEPARENATITSDQTTTLDGSFVQRGSLRVITSPAVAGTITVDGVATDDWGMWTDVPVGSHQVCFGAVADYDAPACQNADVTAGNQTTVTGTYTSDPGAPGPSGPYGLLRVTTSPALPSQISINGVPADSWGLNWVKLPPGSYTITFSHVEGYSEPDPQTVTVTDGDTTPLIGTFTQRGSLRVSTSPALAGTITVDGVPRDDWGVWTDVPVGSHLVCFGAVAGKSTPACQMPTVNAGQLTTITGSYS